jgi:hypothetical protein
MNICYRRGTKHRFRQSNDSFDLLGDNLPRDARGDVSILCLQR